MASTNGRKRGRRSFLKTSVAAVGAVGTAGAAAGEGGPSGVAPEPSAGAALRHPRAPTTAPTAAST